MPDITAEVKADVRIIFNIELQKPCKEQSYDACNLDHRVDGRPRGVFVGIAHGVARDYGLMRVSCRTIRYGSQ